MTDYFALFNVPRRPWLEVDALKQAFLVRAAGLHPDKLHSEGAAARSDAAKSFAELNAAYHCLGEPKSRLLHLLQLELGARPEDIQQIPAALADQFAAVAAACRNADGFLAERNRVTSPLLQVQWFERGQAWVEKLNALQHELNSLHGQFLDQLKTLDEKWMRRDAVDRPQLLAEAEQLYRQFGYFNRWNQQIQERVARLST